MCNTSAFFRAPCKKSKKHLKNLLYAQGQLSKQKKIFARLPPKELQIGEVITSLDRLVQYGHSNQTHKQV
jgi:hypothetical protein